MVAVMRMLRVVYARGSLLSNVIFLPDLLLLLLLLSLVQIQKFHSQEILTLLVLVPLHSVNVVSQCHFFGKVYFPKKIGVGPISHLPHIF